MRPTFRRTVPALLLAVVGSGGLLFAQTTPNLRPAVSPPQPRSTPGAAASPRVVDPASSRILVKVGAEGYGHVHGVQGRLLSGKLVLGGPGELVFDMRGFVADPPAARSALGLARPVSASDQRKVTANMLGRDVLDVGRYPTAIYAVERAAPLDGQGEGQPGRYRLEGSFTLHGVSRPLAIDTVVEATNNPAYLRMSGAFAILQTHYGMTPYSALAGLVRVADRLEISGDLFLYVPAS
jgi:polyisoprenoid-binding protein YceI